MIHVHSLGVSDWLQSSPAPISNRRSSLTASLSHFLRFVLAKERNLLQSEKLAYARARAMMPDPARLTKVRKGMNRIKQVMSERLKEHEDPAVRLQLKAFIDSM